MKNIILIAVSLCLASCNSKIELNPNCVVVKNVEATADGKFLVGLVTTNGTGSNMSNDQAFFITKYKYQAGDTLITADLLNEVSISKLVNLSLQIDRLRKDSIWQAGLIYEFDNKLKDYEMENKALRNVLKDVKK